MKKIQCTFRLPENVVEIIDSQVGGTRTDKLLALLGFEKESNDYSAMHDVINKELEVRLLNLESRIAELESSNRTSKITSSNKGNSANKARKMEALEKLSAELDSISVSDYEIIRNARYPLSEVRKRTSISKSQCDSYKEVIFQRLGL